MRMPIREDPEIALMEAIIGGNPSNAIARQEKRGQFDLVNSTCLPIEFNSGTREQLEMYGVVFGEKIDELFCNALLPDGWTKVATDHPMWSNLVDDKGRKRASIFYKAAFYDRCAFINVTPRFTHCVEPVLGWQDKNYNNGKWHGVVKDGESIIWASEEIGPEPSYKDREESIAFIDQKDALKALARKWLEKHYPDYEDQSAYWE